MSIRDLTESTPFTGDYTGIFTSNSDTSNFFEIDFLNMGVTIGAIIQYCLNKNPHVSFCVNHYTHALDNNMRLRFLINSDKSWEFVFLSANKYSDLFCNDTGI